MTEIMLADTARGARSALRGAALLQCRRRRPEGPLRPVDPARHPSHQGRLRDGARQAQPYAGVRHRLSNPRRHLPARLHPRHRSHARAHGGARATCARAGASDIFNCGYGRGFSVLEVIDAVKRASGRDFEVRLSPRRPGDPARVVAATERIRHALAWMPEHDNLDTIVRHALALGGAAVEPAGRRGSCRQNSALHRRLGSKGPPARRGPRA